VTSGLLPLLGSILTPDEAKAKILTLVTPVFNSYSSMENTP